MSSSHPTIRFYLSITNDRADGNVAGIQEIHNVRLTRSQSSPIFVVPGERLVRGHGPAPEANLPPDGFVPLRRIP